MNSHHGCLVVTHPVLYAGEDCWHRRSFAATPVKYPIGRAFGTPDTQDIAHLDPTTRHRCDGQRILTTGLTDSPRRIPNEIGVKENNERSRYLQRYTCIDMVSRTKQWVFSIRLVLHRSSILKIKQRT